MKRLNLLLPILLLLAVNQLLAQGKAVISGKVSNPLSPYVALAVSPNLLVPDEENTQVELKDNTFRIEVSLESAVVAELLHGEEVVPVYLEPGYELEVRFNGGKFLKTLKYRGKGANENNYLAAYNTRFDEEEDYQVLPDNIKLREQQFTEFLDYRREDQLNSLEKYTSKREVSDTFRDFILAEIEFSYAKDKLSYHPLRQQIMQAALSKPSAGFYAFLSELDMQRPANLLSSTFGSFLRSYTAFLTQETGVTGANEHYYQAGYQMASRQLQGKALLLAQAQVLKQSIQFGHLEYTEQMLQDYKAKSGDKDVTAYLTRLYNDYKDFSIGSTAPDFTLQHISGDTVSLSDYRGQLVYLNFWRTNCGLCQVELQHLQQLTSMLKGHKVVFLNVALDEDEAKWRKTVLGKQLLGEHVFQQGPEAELVQRYHLKDVPAYFLVDELGRFISLKARRPSDHEAANEIMRHLEVRQASLK